MTEPADAWAGERVARWLKQSAQLEQQLAPVSDVLFSAAGLTPGERVLDVGCGTGPTTRRAADQVGPTGGVTALDVSAEMLQAAAAASNPTDSSAPTTWVEADVTTWTPPVGTYDVVISRFGVMFFSDPDAAFTNLAVATRVGGRLAMAVWARRDESDLFELPLQAVLSVRRAHGIADPDDLPLDGGPYSLSDVAATTNLLERTGWSDVNTAVHDLRLHVAGGASPAIAAATAADVGPTRLVLAGLEQPVREEATADIVAALADRVGADGGVVLGGRVIIVTASR